MTAGTWALMVLLAGIWGSSFFFITVALRGMSSHQVVFGRVLLATLALYGFIYATGRRMPADRATWTAYLVMGVLNILIPFSLIAWAQQNIEGGLASILNATKPVYAVVLAHFLTSDEKLTPNRGVGVLLGFAGVAVLVGFDGQNDGKLSAILAVLLAAFCYACAGIYGKRFKGSPPFVSAAGMLTCTLLIMLPLVLVFDPPWHYSPGWSSLLAVASLGLFSTALAYFLYFRLLADAGATNASLATLLVPVSAIVLGGMFLDERLTPAAMAGMALIAVGLLVIDGRLFRKLWHTRSTGN